MPVKANAATSDVIATRRFSRSASAVINCVEAIFFRQPAMVLRPVSRRGEFPFLDSIIFRRRGLPPACWSDTIRLNRVVDEIRWEPGHVEVLGRTANGAPFEPQQASRAIVALPLGVLPSAENPSAAVRFSPRLEAKEQAVAQMRMGPVVKVLLRFQEPFWAGGELRDQTFWHSSQPVFPTWWTHLPVHAPVLTGWSAGPAALALAGQTDAAILDRALDVLASVARLARPRLDQQLQSWHVCNWQADPLARGAYSYATVGGLGSRRQLADPVADTLFFAGEATGGGLSGTVNAAIASGYRAADEVLRAVHPSVG
jgi:monoamine oxidase